MNPSSWGPSLWKSIHYIALGFPDMPTSTDRENYLKFFKNLGKVLPCYKCSVNYEAHLNELPIESFITNSDMLFKWTVQLHNIVNRDTGKREISLDEAYAIYKSGSASEMFLESFENANEHKTENKTGGKVLTTCERYTLYFAVLINILIIAMVIFLLLSN